MKRIKIQRGYLAKKQPKKAKYYDQSLGANTVLPPRELLMHKTREEKDMGRLLSYVNALQSLSKPEKAWYENVAKKTKSGWEKVKDYLSNMNLLYSYDDWDKEYEEAMREERARREKDMKKDEVKIVPTDDSRISQILRDIEQSRKKENISKYFLERDRERYRRAIPTDDVVVGDDDVDEDEGEYDVTDDDDDDKKESPHQNKRDVLDKNPDVEEIWMPDGSKVFKNKEVPISALTTRETPRIDSMQPVNNSSITLRPVGDSRSLVVERTDPPLSVVTVSQGNTATSLSSGEQDALAHTNRVSKSVQQNQEMTQEALFLTNLHKLLTERRVGEQLLNDGQIKLLAQHPAILKSYLNGEVPMGLNRELSIIKKNTKDEAAKKAFAAFNEYLLNYEYALKYILPRAIPQFDETTVTPEIWRDMVRESAGNINDAAGQYRTWLATNYPRQSTADLEAYIRRLNKAYDEQITPKVKSRKK